MILMLGVLLNWMFCCYTNLWVLSPKVITRSGFADMKTTRKKTKKTRCLRRDMRLMAVAIGIAIIMNTPSGLSAQPASNELPEGWVVRNGAALPDVSGSNMTVNQSTSRAVIDWNRFNIGAAAAVKFSVPDAGSSTLNRVVTSTPSEIFGSLSSNGQLFLINPSGILFGRQSSVNVGSLVASTMALDPDGFMDGKYRFTRNGSKASVENLGTVKALDGGLVALFGTEIRNEGVIEARLGQVTLASAEALTLTRGDGLWSVEVDPATVSALIENRGIIRADGGAVLMRASTADALSGSVVNTGEVRARTIGERNGRIVLLGDMESGSVMVSGTLDASAPEGGNGGFVETSAAKVRVADDAIVTRLAPYGNAGTWLIDPDGFTIAASLGDMTGHAVEQALAGGPLEIKSSAGTGSDGNINVNDTIDWNANTLTLTATGDININAVMKASGNAKLFMNTGSSSRVNCLLTPSGFIGKIDFPGRSGSGFLTINGSSYTVIADVNQLQAMQSNDPAVKYALGGDIEAAETSAWDGNHGFKPVGDSGSSSLFRGKFDGLGHKISNLTINRPDTDNVGLFGQVWDGAFIRNVGLVNPDIVGQSYVGGFAGYMNNNIPITNAYTSGGTVRGTEYFVGGLCGYINMGTTITNSYNTSSISGGKLYVGGLVGFSGYDVTISNSYNTGTVEGGYVGGIAGYINYNTTLSNSYNTGSVGGDSYIGGIAGYINYNTTLSNSYNAGSVDGDSYIGGIAGYIFNTIGTGSIIESYNSGNITGTQAVGGIAGAFAGGSSITESYNAGSVTGTQVVGGIAGSLSGGSSITESYNAGSVSGTQKVGGVAGELSTSGRIENSYNWGHVSGTESAIGPVNDVGGVAGSLDSSTIINSYNSGLVSGAANNIGGFLGQYQSGTVTAGFWDTQTSGVSQGIGNNVVLPGLRGETTANMKRLATFSDKGWDITTQYGGSSIWRIYDYDTYPLLRWTLTDWAQKYAVGSVTKQYDAIVFSGGTATPTPPVSTVPPFVFFGGNAQGAKNAGTYNINLYSWTYDVDFTPGNLTIEPRANALTISGSKIYNGTVNLSPEQVTITTDLGEILSCSGVTAVDKNVLYVGNYINAITLENGTGSNAGLAGNYLLPVLSHTTAPVTITPKMVSLSATKTYDGLVDLTGSVTITTGVLTETLNYSNAIASNAHVNVSGKYISNLVLQDGSSGGLAGNYQLPSMTVAGQDNTLTITAKEVTANAVITGVTKEYDGTKQATGSKVTGTLTDVVGTDTIDMDVIGVHLAYNDAHVATTGKMISATGLVSLGKLSSTGSGNQSGTDASNLVISYISDYRIKAQPTIVSVSGEITAKEVTGTAGIVGNVDKTYDGLVTTTATVIGTVTSELVGEDRLSLNTAGVMLKYDNANAGTRQINAKGNVSLGSVQSTGSGLMDGSSTGNEVMSLAGDYVLNPVPSITSVTGTISAAPLNITANDARKIYDGIGYSGGNGVTYAGFVNGDNEYSALRGLLSYIGDSQGAIEEGAYTIMPKGLTASNYKIAFINGVLTITRTPIYDVVYEDASKIWNLTVTNLLRRKKIYLDPLRVRYLSIVPAEPGSVRLTDRGMPGSGYATVNEPGLLHAGEEGL